jgi:hypothetical protein
VGVMTTENESAAVMEKGTVSFHWFYGVEGQKVTLRTFSTRCERRFCQAMNRDHPPDA